MKGPMPLKGSDLPTLRKLRVRCMWAAGRSRWPWSFWHQTNARTIEKFIDHVERTEAAADCWNFQPVGVGSGVTGPDRLCTNCGAPYRDHV